MTHRADSCRLVLFTGLMMIEVCTDETTSQDKTRQDDQLQAFICRVQKSYLIRQFDCATRTSTFTKRINQARYMVKKLIWLLLP